MQGHFVMFLLGNIANSKFSFKEIKDQLTQIGEELGMEIWVQRKEIFDKIKNLHVAITQRDDLFVKGFLDSPVFSLITVSSSSKYS